MTSIPERTRRREPDEDCELVAPEPAPAPVTRNGIQRRREGPGPFEDRPCLEGRAGLRRAHLAPTQPTTKGLGNATQIVRAWRQAITADSVASKNRDVDVLLVLALVFFFFFVAYFPSLFLLRCLSLLPGFQRRLRRDVVLFCWLTARVCGDVGSSVVLIPKARSYDSGVQAKRARASNNLHPRIIMRQEMAFFFLIIMKEEDGSS